MLGAGGRDEDEDADEADQDGDGTYDEAAKEGAYGGHGAYDLPSGPGLRLEPEVQVVPKAEAQLLTAVTHGRRASAGTDTPGKTAIEESPSAWTREQERDRRGFEAHQPEQECWEHLSAPHVA